MAASEQSRTHAAVTGQGSALERYQRVIVGRPGWLRFIYFEICTLLSVLPGALGLALRRFFWPPLFAECGQGTVFGANVSLRHPHRIALGARIVVSDGCILDARNEEVDTAIQIGDEASFDNLCANTAEARIVHFATHGKLDHKQPEQSYLLLAGGYRLGVLDIQDLPLNETDLVVLSACQTGIGKEGMEFATLARAFAHAGVPTTVATLWSVNDVATRALMQKFYGHLTDGDDVFKALAKAQRATIAAGGKHAAPRMWSAFLPFGRP